MEPRKTDSAEQSPDSE